MNVAQSPDQPDWESVVNERNKALDWLWLFVDAQDGETIWDALERQHGEKYSNAKLQEQETQGDKLFQDGKLETFAPDLLRQLATNVNRNVLPESSDGTTRITADGDYWRTAFNQGDALRLQAESERDEERKAKMEWAKSAQKLKASNDELLAALKDLHGAVVALEGQNIEYSLAMQLSDKARNAKAAIANTEGSK